MNKKNITKHFHIEFEKNKIKMKDISNWYRFEHVVSLLRLNIRD